MNPTQLNSWLVNEYTQAISEVLWEVVGDPSTFIGQKILPAVNKEEHFIVTTMINDYGGLASDHLIGSDTKRIAGAGYRNQTFSPMFTKEFIQMNEKDITYLRDIFSKDLSKTGVLEYLNTFAMQLDLRMENKIEKLRWDALLYGQVEYFDDVVSYGIPVENRVYPVTAPWFLQPDNQANPAADPVKDLRYWLSGGVKLFRKYKIKDIYMNSNTARVFMDNPNTKDYIPSGWMSNTNIQSYDITKIAPFLVTGLPPITVYDGVWMPQTEDNDGQITTGDGVYFIPDGLILFDCDFKDKSKLGDFILGINPVNLMSGSRSYGKFILIEDCTLSGTRGGLNNPFINIYGGFSGGPRINRSRNVLTADVNQRF